MASVRCTAQEIDIRPSCLQMLKDIGHPYARGEKVYDIAFENVQAGERTSHLFRLANFNGGFVVGTGDLCELALGWCTYGVGDHMSHYNVNASVPKTLIKHLVRWVAASGSVERGDDPVLDEILATQISPELVPGDGCRKRRSPSRAARRASARTSCRTSTSTRSCATATRRPRSRSWRGRRGTTRARARGPTRPTCQRNAYTLAEIKKHLRTFCWRFFKTSQFKRSAVPNAPKVGSGGSLSPRGDWRAPSDSEATVWLEDVERIPDA